MRTTSYPPLFLSLFSLVATTLLFVWFYLLYRTKEYEDIILRQSEEIEKWTNARSFKSGSEINYSLETSIQPLPINKYSNYERENRKRINYDRIVEYELEYRREWKSNNQVKFSDHVYYEPKWNVVMKCPEQHLNYISYEINPLTRKKKQLGVYLTLISIGENNYLRKENTAECPFLAFKNWKDNLISKYPHTLIIFYFGQLTERIYHKIQFIFKDVKNLKIIYEPVSDILRRSFDNKVWNGRLQYYTMSKFLAHDLYQHPLLKDYVYYMRLDSDLKFNKPITYDPFKFMHVNGLLVGYGLLGMPECGYTSDAESWTRTLQEKVNSYFLLQGVLPLEEIRPNGNFGWADTIHAGPLEINKISVFDNEQYHHFLESIDIWEGMSTYRWREQIVKTLWIKMFVPRMSTHWFCDLDVWHKINFRERCHIVCETKEKDN
ncbi:hypothetical protein ABK040_013921 [Willaertia magna]